MSMSGHLGDLLSALLDGELEYSEAAGARAHLQGCPFCRAELDATAATRALVRALPMVDPPPGLIDDVLSRPAAVVPIAAARTHARGTRPLAALAGVAAAAALVVLSLSPRPPRTATPPVSTFVDAHATSSSDSDPVSGLAPVAVPASFSP
jgi:anti-sigma factor RsiW